MARLDYSKSSLYPNEIKMQSLTPENIQNSTVKFSSDLLHRTKLTILNLDNFQVHPIKFESLCKKLELAYESMITVSVAWSDMYFNKITKHWH
jgi:hypothetical protein